jgi:hypothetical protein
MGKVSHISRQIDLMDAGDRITLLMQKAKGDVLIEMLDMLMPLLTIEEPMHEFSLLLMKDSIASQAKLPTSLTHDEAETVIPHDREILRTFEKIFGTLIRSQN